MSRVKILPSLLSADFANLQTEVEKCESAGADILHLDIMDGHFVPNITFGPAVTAAVKRVSDLPLDCHLMIAEPDKYIGEFAKAGADFISVHAETCPHLHRTLSLIRESGAKSGLALNPATPIEYAFEAAEYLDFVLLMSVNPGFGGQSFIPSYYRRAERLKEHFIKNGVQGVAIEIDGGVKPENAREIALAGADWLVCGSGLFHGDFNANMKNMRKSLEGI